MIQPLKFIQPLKATLGYHEGEVSSVEAILSWFKYPEDYPLSFEKKYDGLRLQWHKKGNTIKVFTEGGFDVTDRFPSLVEELKKVPYDIILDTETEGWSGKKHWGREEISGYVNGEYKVPEDFDKKYVVVNVFDLLYINSDFKHHELPSGDLHDEPYMVRRKVLEYLREMLGWQSTDKIPKPGFNVVPMHIIEKDDPKEIEKVVKQINDLPASEGVMIKSTKGKYPLSGHTNSWLKYKKSMDLHVVVLKRIETKTPGVYNYRVGLISDKGDEFELKNGKKVKVMDVGKTFNTKLKAEKGDILTVLPHTVFLYPDGTIRLYETKVYEKRPDQVIPDDVNEAIKLAKIHGILAEKYGKEIILFGIEVPLESDMIGFVDQFGNIYLRQDKEYDFDGIIIIPLNLEIVDTLNVYKELVKENPDKDVEVVEYYAEPRKFVIQHHIRGASEHLDFRYENDEGTLDGFTIAPEYANRLSKVLRDLFTVKKEGDLRKVYWKGKLFYVYNMETDEVTEYNKKLEKDIYRTLKQLVQKDQFWKIDMESGQVKERESAIEKGQIATKVWATTKAKEPHEWLNVEGVFPPREVEPVPGGTRFWPGVFITVDRGILYKGADKPYFKEFFLRGKKWKGRYVFRLVPGKEGEFQWLFWKAEDETPYVLSKRAVKVGWIPKEGSALPPEWEKKVPKDLRWWEVKDIKEKKKRRDQFVEQLKEKLESFKSVFQYIWCRGPIVVRRGPSHKVYLLTIPGHTIVFDGDPRKDAVPAKIMKGDLSADDEVPPEHPLNPNKELTCKAITLDEYKLKTLIDEPLVKKYDLDGEFTLLLTRTDPNSEIWSAKMEPIL